ncbi:hypothetical protein M413DRAFT_438626 [Hebeloma cylindrosporum]|uniref:Uncharacterized protein n=1 Tax=Hebeloma cylindrosporum TaxID=76867 RepID=A0A0C3CZY7_HEBCY|nr:hypothetical protein M413DRAFT_438626 [Hebeloma cylindrosporum h7]
MVQLILSSTKGNQGLRYFPYSGYLGLTPIRVEGIVRTKLDADLKTLQARSLTISVRCYESRIGRVNVLQSNILVDYTQVLWTKPDGVDYEQIGNLEFPFRISIPAKVAGFSTAIFVDYRCMWRVEAVLTHAPLSGVGSRQIRHFELPLIRYDLPPSGPIAPTLEPLLNQETNKPRAPRLRYSINSPKSPIGPLDLVPIPIHLKPLDRGVSIRSASVIVERRIFLRDVGQAPSSTLSPPIPGTLQPNPSTSSLAGPSSPPLLQSPSSKSTYPDSPPYLYHEQEPELSSTLSLTSSVPTVTPGAIFHSTASLASETTPLLPNSSNHLNIPLSSQTPSVKVIVNPIAGAESSGNFALDAQGMWSKTLTLQWPAPKSHSRWAIGETITSELVSVKFFIRAKVIVTSPSGTETLELADQELLIVSTNEAERQLALAKYNEMQDAMIVNPSSRSKSKSPRRSRPEREDPIPPSPGVSDLANATSSSYRSKSRSRRPHTSAGPRDKPVNFAGGAYERPRGQDGEASGHANGSEGNGEGSSNSTGAAAKRRSDGVIMRSTRPDRNGLIGGGKNSMSFWSTVHSNGVSPPRVKGVPSGNSTSTTASSSSVSSSSHGGESDKSDHMKEWEEELARIEMRSRRSSDLLGFSGKRKRSTGVPRMMAAILGLDT